MLWWNLGGNSPFSVDLQWVFLCDTLSPAPSQSWITQPLGLFWVFKNFLEINDLECPNQGTGQPPNACLRIDHPPSPPNSLRSENFPEQGDVEQIIGGEALSVHLIVSVYVPETMFYNWMLNIKA